MKNDTRLVVVAPILTSDFSLDTGFGLRPQSITVHDQFRKASSQIVRNNQRAGGIRQLDDRELFIRSNVYGNTEQKFVRVQCEPCIRRELVGFKQAARLLQLL
jgi:hypothetical protein